MIYYSCTISWGGLVVKNSTLTCYTTIWHVWTKNLRGMDFKYWKLWTGIGPLNHASTLNVIFFKPDACCTIGFQPTIMTSYHGQKSNSIITSSRNLWSILQQIIVFIVIFFSMCLGPHTFTFGFIIWIDHQENCKESIQVVCLIVRHARYSK